MTVTLEDVAARVGVSRALVSLVMRGSPRVSEKSREAVLAAAAELRYQPNLIARQLASARTATLGVLASDLHNPVFADVFDGAEAEATGRGYRLLIAAGFRDRRREREAIDAFIGFRVDGVILVGSILAPELIRAFAERIRLVVLGRRVRGVDFIAADDERGARLAVEHLITLGHRHIAHIDGGRGAGAALRRSVYLTVMTERGLRHNVQVASGNYAEEGGEAAARLLLEAPRRPTAIFAANDLCASGVLQVAHQQGLGVPADLSVVGFDNTLLARAGYISLTSIDYSREAMGSAAVELLLDQLDGAPGPRQLLLPPSLVVRASTAPPRV